MSPEVVFWSSLVTAGAAFSTAVATFVLARRAIAPLRALDLERSRQVTTQAQFATELVQVINDLGMLRGLLEKLESGAQDPDLEHLVSKEAFESRIDLSAGRLQRLRARILVQVAETIHVCMSVAEMHLEEARICARSLGEDWGNRHYELHERLRHADAALRRAYKTIPERLRQAEPESEIAEIFSREVEETRKEAQELRRPPHWPKHWSGPLDDRETGS